MVACSKSMKGSAGCSKWAPHMGSGTELLPFQPSAELPVALDKTRTKARGRQEAGKAPSDLRANKSPPTRSPSATFPPFLRNDRNQEILLRLAGFCPGLSNPQRSPSKLLETAL